MVYIRTNKNRVLWLDQCPLDYDETIINCADTIKELIMIGDLIVWYNSSSKRDEYFYIHNEDELFAAKQYPIKQVFIKVGNDFRLVAKANEKEDLELL